MTTTVIVGGVAGGMSAAARLRRLDENMTIIVLEASANVSFANCGLPYHVGQVITRRESLLLQTPASLYERFRIDVRVNSKVAAINRDQNTVQVINQIDGQKYDLEYDFLILSPGASPVIPAIDGIERAFTLRNVEDVDRINAAINEQTNSALLIGGGFIGLELAENLKLRGLEVTIVEAANQIMAPLDPELAAIVADHLEANGIKILTNVGVSRLGKDYVQLADGRKIQADLVVAAIGVRPADQLAREAGLNTGERGGVVVDDQMRTSDPKIFAVGDVVVKKDANSGQPILVPLAQSANRQGRLVADVIVGRDVHAKPTLGTAIVGLFGLAAGTVGWNEKRARAEGLNPRIIHLHPADHAGYYPGANQIHLKLVVDAQSDAILGAQAVGKSGVDKRIDVIATAMRAGLKARDLVDLELAYAPQFGSAKDPINLAGYIDENMINGQPTRQWYEVEQLREAGWGLIDIRTKAEFERGTIPGAINIPVDEIREHLDQLDRNRNYLLICQVGLRGNVATALLRQLEHNVANLDGGYLTWTHGRSARRRQN